MNYTDLAKKISEDLLNYPVKEESLMDVYNKIVKYAKMKMWRQLNNMDEVGLKEVRGITELKDYGKIEIKLSSVMKEKGVSIYQMTKLAGLKYTTVKSYYNNAPISPWMIIYKNGTK